MLFILMMEAIRSSETSVLTRATPHHILKDGLLHSHHRKTSDLTRHFGFRDMEQKRVAEDIMLSSRLGHEPVI
jgi:hypothetical protein